MYLTLRDRPGAPGGTRPVAARSRVARTVVVLGVVSMLTDISSESVNAVLPKYLVVVVGLSPQAFGLVNGLYNGVSAVVRLAGGWIADRTDRPKWVAVLGYAASALSRVGLLFAGGVSAISWVVVGDRLGKGVRTAPRDAMIAASTPPERLGRAYGVHRMLDSLGAALGPLIAFWVLTVVIDGFHAVFVVSLAFAIMGVALLVLLVPDLHPRRRPAQAEEMPSPAAPHTPPARVTLRLLADPRAAVVSGAAFVLGAVTVGDAYLYLQLQFRDSLASNYYALLMVGMNVAYLVLAVPVGRLADRVGRARVFVGGHVALLLAYLAAAGPLRGAAVSLACLAMLGAYYAATDGVLAALAGQAVPVGLRTSGIALAQTFQSLGAFVSSLLVGLLWAHVGLGAAIGWCGLALLLLVPCAAASLRLVGRRG